MQTVFDKMNFKSMKIANLLVSAKSEIHIIYLHLDSSQNLKDLKRNFFHK